MGFKTWRVIFNTEPDPFCRIRLQISRKLCNIKLCGKAKLGNMEETNVYWLVIGPTNNHRYKPLSFSFPTQPFMSAVYSSCKHELHLWLQQWQSVWYQTALGRLWPWRVDAGQRYWNTRPHDWPHNGTSLWWEENQISLLSIHMVDMTSTWLSQPLLSLRECMVTEAHHLSAIVNFERMHYYTWVSFFYSTPRWVVLHQ